MSARDCACVRTCGGPEKSRRLPPEMNIISYLVPRGWLSSAYPHQASVWPRTPVSAFAIGLAVNRKRRRFKEGAPARIIAAGGSLGGKSGPAFKLPPPFARLRKHGREFMPVADAERVKGRDGDRFVRCNGIADGSEDGRSKSSTIMFPGYAWSISNDRSDSIS